MGRTKEFEIVPGEGTDLLRFLLCQIQNDDTHMHARVHAALMML